MEFNVTIAALAAAYLLDRLFGDPIYFPHPIVGFGKLIYWGEKKINRGRNRVFKGALLTLVLVMLVGCVFFFIKQSLAELNGWADLLFTTFFIFTGLAGTTLIKEGKEVFKKLEISLNEGQQQVARIVGRNTEKLTDHQVRSATLETMAENLSDGVVAPLFWFAVAGIPGIMVYKMINTLDSMIGYKNERYLKFGRFAAKLDDLVNFIPARLTALLMVVVARSQRGLRFAVLYGRSHSSPNAGYPEAALAGILDARFGGPNYYFGELVEKPFIGENSRAFVANDINKAVFVNRGVEMLMIILVALVTLITN